MSRQPEEVNVEEALDYVDALIWSIDLQRMDQDLSKKQLYEAVGMSKTNMSKLFLRGFNPSIITLMKICNALVVV